jgi:LPS-assembly protein
MALRNFRKQFPVFVLTGVWALLLPHYAQAQLLTGYDEEPQAPAAILTGISADDTFEAAHIPDSSFPDEKPVVAQAAAAPSLAVSEEPVHLDAENLVHDEASGIITASGNVFLVQGDKILRADKVIYNLKTDTAEAEGNVVLNEASGNIHYADKVTFNDKLKEGFVQGIQVHMLDGSRFTAREGRHEGGIKTKMRDATYTPCETCRANPEKPPLWQLRASKITHNQEERRISYNDARFEVKGVPVAYLPYFAHPDGTIKRKSGFLVPSAGYKSELGAFVTNKYYWNVAPDRDATLGVTVMTEESPLFTGEYRQRWRNAQFTGSGGLITSKRVDQSGGVNISEDEETRGHVLANGRWDMNEKWRSGVNIAWASDDQYMRQYDFSDEDVLENEVYAERFSGRNYASGRILTFQDIRINEREEEQPQVLPEIVATFRGDPNGGQLVRGRWSLDASLLGLHRDGSAQDMDRIGLQAGWQRRMVSDTGLLTTIDATARADLYNTRGRTVAINNPGLDDDVTAGRFFPQMNIQTSYPMEKPMELVQATIEPIASVTLAPNIDINEDIPNEDSQDVQIDTGNLFESNRFPGLDRVEDQSHFTYGLRSGLYGYNGAYIDAFLGQSHRFQEDDNPFPEGSGLETQDSDIVGQISGASGKRYSFNYRFQLENDSFKSERHEVNATADWDRFYVSSNYLFANSLEGTDIDQNREQLAGAAGYYFSPEWRGRVGARQDLGGENPGLRRAYAGIDYFGQCLSWSLVGQRNLTDDASGESDTEIVFKIGLKNLGGFEESPYRKYNGY